MTIEIDDELLRRMGVTEQDVRIELFARLFDQGKLSFGRAAELAGMTQELMEQELTQRGIPRYRYTEEQFERDKETLMKWEAGTLFREAQ